MSPAKAWLLGLLLVVGSGVLLRLLEVSRADALAILGLVFGLVTVGVQELVRRAPTTRRVAFVSSSASPFSAEILSGLRAGLSDRFEIKVFEPTPPVEVDRRSSEAQIVSLESADVNSADAIVVRPAGNDDRLWEALRRHSQRGCQVIAINTRPPAAAWAARKPTPLPPRYVGTDMQACGTLLGETVARVAMSISADAILLMEGPSEKPSNAVRTLAAVRALEDAETSCPWFVHRLSGWTEQDMSSALRRLNAEVTRALGRPAQSVVLHTATDRAARTIGVLIAEDRNHEGWSRRRIALIGCDGLRDSDGRLAVEDVPYAVATVDQNAYALGREAARQLLLVCDRRESEESPDIELKPRLAVVQRHSRLLD